MRVFFTVLGSMLILAGAASAQGRIDETGYLAGVAQSSFGNVTSQSFGIEGGYYVDDDLTIVLEFGKVLDTVPNTVGPSAQAIASYLDTVQSGPVAYQVSQPAGFLAGGARYAFGNNPKVRPYASGSIGVARVTRDVRFTISGTDVTSDLEQYGVTLGSDLGGSQTKPIFTFGFGAIWRPTGPWSFDAGYRFSHIATDTTGTSINRLGLGVGYSF